jgi:hypothetical protein
MTTPLSIVPLSRLAPDYEVGRHDANTRLKAKTPGEALAHSLIDNAICASAALHNKKPAVANLYAAGLSAIEPVLQYLRKTDRREIVAEFKLAMTNRLIAWGFAKKANTGFMRLINDLNFHPDALKKFVVDTHA